MTNLSTWESRAESNHADKATWRRGEWDNEPDRIEWRWQGPPRLACLIVRGPSGALCGYVGVPPGHPYHGKEYNGLDVDVHGGLTYAEACVEGGHICHVPQPGESDEVWWLGFDCAHSGDFSGMKYGPEDPAVVERPDLFGGGPRLTSWGGYERYCSVAYVRHEVERLAQQLCRVAKGLPAEEEES
jgi:hypothetical protein